MTRTVPPVFVDEEFLGRLAQVRCALHGQALDALVVTAPEDIYYLTGFRSMGYNAWQALLVTADQPPLMVSRKLEERMYRAESCVQDFHGYADSDDPVDATISALSDLGLTRGTIGMPCRGNVSARSWQRLVEALPSVSFADTTSLVARIRQVKSAREIELIREAGSLTRIGMTAGLDAVAEGRNENDAAAECLRAMISAGGEVSSLGPLVATGPRSAFGHASWERRPFSAGDAVFLEVGGCVGRYHTAAMRTASIGEPSSVLRRLEQASRAGLAAALDTLKPGATSHDVDASCRVAVTKNSSAENFRHRAGYSIGIGFETWIDGFSLKPQDLTPIEKGMVLHVVPFLSTDSAAVAISETVVVTDDGVEKLVGLEQELAVR